MSTTPVEAMTGTEFRGLTHYCINPNCHVPDFILSVEDKDPITLIRNDVRELREMVEQVQAFIEPLAGEVAPLIEKLSNSPMFRMITAGGE
jgi:hypothetical protein